MNHFILRFLLPEALLAFDLSTPLPRLLLLLMSFDFETLLLSLPLPLLFPLSALDESFLIGFTLSFFPFDLLLSLDWDLSALERTLGAKADFFSLLLEGFFDCYLDLEVFFLSEDFFVLLSLLLLFLLLDDFGRPLFPLLSLLSLALLILLLREDFGRPLLTSFDLLTLLFFDLLDFLVLDLFKYFEPSSRVAAIVLVRITFRAESALSSLYLTLRWFLSFAMSSLSCINLLASSSCFFFSFLSDLFFKACFLELFLADFFLSFEEDRSAFDLDLLFLEVDNLPSLLLETERDFLEDLRFDLLLFDL